MATSEETAGLPGRGRALRAAQVIIVGSVMFTFISSWRTAAVVLCDLASTAYYIGGIVEQAIGPAAPWFIVAVLLLAFIVGLVYIESCSMFVRGGVYRVVREALGGTAAKLAVSALIFDYILTGPISTVSAGQYIMGLILDSVTYFQLASIRPESSLFMKRWGSVVIAYGITGYFFWQNLKGIHESSDKALKIMIATTIMAVVMFAWSGLTLAFEEPPTSDQHGRALPPLEPRLEKKTEYGTAIPRIDPGTGQQFDPLGFLAYLLPASWIESIRSPSGWLSFFGIIGLCIAFGHSILAMSGLETMAQVYREVESPKLPNFKKAAVLIFTYALGLTGTISFLAVVLIPERDRLGQYVDNLLGGIAMNVAGPYWLRLLLNAFVTVVGFLILSGACNTSIIGANGVLNRVAEDGILPGWLRRPHRRYGTSHRVLLVILALQLFTIVASRGDILILGEAYAFGVVWSFVFMSFSMFVLRFTDPRPREFKVPLNLPVGKFEIPIGLGLILLVLLVAAVCNLLTKPVATVGGLIFAGAFFALFTITERISARRLQAGHQHLEQFNPVITDQIDAASLGLEKPYRKLVAIRSPQNLYMLEKALAETDPDITDVVVMTAKTLPQTDLKATVEDLDRYDQELMTAVVNLAEKAGKEVTPLIVTTNSPLHAVAQTAKQLHSQEIIVGASNKFTADDQLEQIAFYWLSVWDGTPPPVTLRILSRDRDLYLDLAGGNRIPRISERKARTVAELRAAGVGVDRVMLVYDGSPAGSDLFHGVLTMLDSHVDLAVVPLVPPGQSDSLVQQDCQRAQALGRTLQVIPVDGDPGTQIVRLARENQYDLIILSVPAEAPSEQGLPLPPWADHVLRHAHCRVFLTAPPIIPHEVVDTAAPVEPKPEAPAST